MVASSLERLGRLRDFDDSTLEGAKNAASVLGFIKTSAGYSTPNMTQAYTGTQWQNYATMPLNRNTWMFLPPTADAEVMEAKPSNVTYGEFVNRQLTAASHPLQLPENMATNSSKDYNFSSARLDQQKASVFVDFIRQLLDVEVNDRVFKIFYTHILEDTILSSPTEIIDIIPRADDLNIKWRYPLPPDIQPTVREQMFQLMYEWHFHLCCYVESVMAARTW